MVPPVASCTQQCVARRTRVGTGFSRVLAILLTSGPLMRTSASAPRPGGVATAAIVVLSPIARVIDSANLIPGVSVERSSSRRSVSHLARPRVLGRETRVSRAVAVAGRLRRVLPTSRAEKPPNDRESLLGHAVLRRARVHLRWLDDRVEMCVASKRARIQSATWQHRVLGGVARVLAPPNDVSRLLTRYRPQKKCSPYRFRAGTCLPRFALGQNHIGFQCVRLDRHVSVTPYCPVISSSRDQVE